MEFKSRADYDRKMTRYHESLGNYDYLAMDCVSAFVESEAFVCERKVFFEKIDKKYPYRQTKHLDIPSGTFGTILKSDEDELTQEDFESIYDMFS